MQHNARFGPGSELSQLAFAQHAAAQRNKDLWGAPPPPISSLLHQLFLAKEGPTKHVLFQLIRARKTPTPPASPRSTHTHCSGSKTHHIPRDFTSYMFERAKVFNSNNELQTEADFAKAVKDKFTADIEEYFKRKFNKDRSCVWKGDDPIWTNKDLADLRKRGKNVSSFYNTAKIKLADPSMLMEAFKKLQEADQKNLFKITGIYVATLKKQGKKNVGLLLVIQCDRNDRKVMMDFLCNARAPKFNSFPVKGQWVLLARQTEDARLFVKPSWKIDSETRARAQLSEKVRGSKRRNITKLERKYQKDAFHEACNLFLPKMLPIDVHDAPRVNYNVRIFDGKSFTDSPHSMTSADGTLLEPLAGHSYVILNPTMGSWV
jgi:hypothetical protein